MQHLHGNQLSKILKQDTNLLVYWLLFIDPLVYSFNDLLVYWFTDSLVYWFIGLLVY